MAESWTPELTELVRSHAMAAGFALCGVAEAPLAAEPEGVRTAGAFRRWVDAGYAGEMEYLKRRDAAGELLRSSARTALPWARSIVVCAWSYHFPGPQSLEPAAHDAGWIARYAWGGDAAGAPLDYHDDLLGRLRAVERELQAHTACESRCFVDTGPLLERDFAGRAGVGWIGKNTCVLNQREGSWLLLGVIVTSLMVPAGQLVFAAPDRCGSCTRCIDACPTDALLATAAIGGERTMDASRCIAYLTIEQKGPIAVELREGMGRQIFGCDICQEVCPWNRRAPPASDAGVRARPELINPSLGELGRLDGSEFKRGFAGSPLERTKLHRLKRNVAIAMGNSGDPSFHPQLEAWAAAAASDPVLAESATWALERLRDAKGRERTTAELMAVGQAATAAEGDAASIGGVQAAAGPEGSR